MKYPVRLSILFMIVMVSEAKSISNNTDNSNIFISTIYTNVTELKKEISSLKTDITSIKTTNCTLEKCNFEGFCLSDDTCRCRSDYATHDCPPGIECCYKRKSRVLAFLMQFFFGFLGIGEFIIGQNVLGAVPYIIFVGCLLFLVFEMKVGDGENALCARAMYSVGMLIYWLYTVITIGNGEQNDGNGVGLSDW